MPSPETLTSFLMVPTLQNDRERAIHFGNFLRAARVTLDISQNELARRAEIDAAYVNRLEHGKATGTTSRRVLLQLAEALTLGPRLTDRLLYLGDHATLVDWQMLYELRCESKEPC